MESSTAVMKPVASRVKPADGAGSWSALLLTQSSSVRFTPALEPKHYPPGATAGPPPRQSAGLSQVLPEPPKCRPVFKSLGHAHVAPLLGWARARLEDVRLDDGDHFLPWFRPDLEADVIKEALSLAAP